MRIILLGLLLLGLVAVNLYVSHNHTSERQSKHLLRRNGLDFENPDEEKGYSTSPIHPPVPEEPTCRIYLGHRMD
jgi:hypothetical protein